MIYPSNCNCSPPPLVGPFHLQSLPSTSKRSTLILLNAHLHTLRAGFNAKVLELAKKNRALQLALGREREKCGRLEERISSLALGQALPTTGTAEVLSGGFRQAQAAAAGGAGLRLET